MMASKRIDDEYENYDGKLLTPPPVPEWLGSLCSQTNSYSDATLPKIFTPRGNISDVDMAMSFLSQNYDDGTFRFQRDKNPTFAVKSRFLKQHDPENLSQCRPLLQPWSGTKKDSDNGITNEEQCFLDPSQPWPSCHMKKNPSSQAYSSSCSMIREKCIPLVPSYQDGTDDTDEVCDPSFALDYSPSFSLLSLSANKNSSQFLASGNYESSQQEFRNPNKRFVSAKTKSDLTKRDGMQGFCNMLAIPFSSAAKNSVPTCESAPNVVFRTPTICSKVKSIQGNDKNIHAYRQKGDAHFPMNCMRNNSASSPVGHTGLYTPAGINFQGPVGTGMKLRSVDEIPKPFRSLFPFPFFNAVQSLAFEQLLYSDTSVVVSAPTGSGKTVLFELATIRLMLCAQVPLKDIKVIYSPMKSLCAERVDDWRQKFSPLGLQCVELTGDSDLSDFSSLLDVQLICTTPEKWDSVTRRWKDNRQLFRSICLVCIDEVHMVGDSQRGATVEAVITRMKMVQTMSTSNAARSFRFVAVSATLPNTEDIADWLSLHTNKASVFNLGEEYRPVKLQRVVLGYPFYEGLSEFRFDLSLTYKLHSIINNYCHGKPTLVFCSSRKSCQQTAETLIKSRWGNSSFIMSKFHQDIRIAASRVQERKLSDVLMSGIGIHHAGLAVQDRKLVEDLFRAGKLAVLIATSTLSVGVNLPAHLVVVKATHMYLMGVAREYSDQQVLQMIGRAGRPQFDTSATVVIMTKAQLKAKYEALVNGTQVIESRLHKNLTEHINVEVVLNTITDMADAASWLSHTFLHVRATKSPQHYGMSAELAIQQVELKLQDMCMTAINMLNDHQLVAVDHETAMTSPTERGRLMARYCLEFQTMKRLSDIPLESNMKHLVGVVSNCQEFQDVQLRSSEKKTLNSLNKNNCQETIRYPLNGKIKTKQMKVNCLIQAGLGCLAIQDYSLSQDLLKIFRVGQRITKCLMELQWLGEDHTTLLSAVHLCKAFKARLWPDSTHVARQLEGIGPFISQALVQAGLTSFQLLETADPQYLELVVNRHPPFGNRVRDAITHLPRYELVIQQDKNHQATSAELVISISVLNAEEIRSSSTCGTDHCMVFIVGDEDNTIVYKSKLWDRVLVSQTWRRKVLVRRALTGPVLHVDLISQEWAGLDIHTEYQPFYTVSHHPQHRVKEVKPSGAAETKTVSRTKKRTSARKTSQGPKSSKRTATVEVKKAWGQIEQELDIMQLKLQQFEPTGPDTMDTVVMGGKDGFCPPSAMALYEGVHKSPQDLAAAYRSILPLSSNKHSLRAVGTAANMEEKLDMSCEDQDLLSPEIKLLTEPWGDFVNDFWQEEDCGEPTRKISKMTDDSPSEGFGPVLKNQTSASSSFLPYSVNSCVNVNISASVSSPSNNLETVFPVKKSASHISNENKNHYDKETECSSPKFAGQDTCLRIYADTNACYLNVDRQNATYDREECSISQSNHNTPQSHLHTFTRNLGGVMQSTGAEADNVVWKHSTETSIGACEVKIESRKKQLGVKSTGSPQQPMATVFSNDRSQVQRMCALKTESLVKRTGGKENFPNPLALGWEHLQLYQASRESFMNQDTQASLDGIEDDWGLSQPAVKQQCHQQKPMATAVLSAPRPAVSTAPNPHHFRMMEQLDVLPPLSAENFLDGIF